MAGVVALVLATTVCSAQHWHDCTLAAFAVKNVVLLSVSTALIAFII